MEGANKVVKLDGCIVGDTWCKVVIESVVGRYKSCVVVERW